MEVTPRSRVAKRAALLASTAIIALLSACQSMRHRRQWFFDHANHTQHSPAGTLGRLRLVARRRGAAGAAPVIGGSRQRPAELD